MSRKIVANYFVSLDGVVSSPDQWHFSYFDDEMGAAVGAGFERSDSLLMGGTLYREWSEYWPAHADDDFGPVMNGIPSTSSAPHPGQGRLVQHHADQGRRRRADPGGQGPAGQGHRDVRQRHARPLAAAEGLLDELNLLVHPVVVGTGARLFPDGTPKQPLQLAGSTAFGSGVLHLVYRPAPAA